MRLGLCCLFMREAIRFRTTTATALEKLDSTERIEKLRVIAAYNAKSLHAAIAYCASHDIRIAYEMPYKASTHFVK